MKIEKLKPGQTVYSVRRRKMGNTTIGTTVVYRTQIISIDPENRFVIASVNGNPPREYFPAQLSKLRKEKPVLIRGLLGNYRLATKKDKLKGLGND